MYTRTKMKRTSPQDAATAINEIPTTVSFFKLEE